MSTLRTKVVSAFQIHGLTLQRNAMKALLSYLDSCPASEHQNLINKIIEQLQQQESDSLLIDEECVSKAIEVAHGLIDGSSTTTDNIFTIIDAFTIPKFKLVGEKKKFTKCVDSRSLFGVASMKADMYINRYNLIYQRLQRHELFKPAIVGDSTRGQKFKLQPVEYLLGSSATSNDIVIFGILTQLTEGKYYIEDPTGAAQLDLSNAKYHTGLFTEGCFVLAEGNYEDKIFRVKGLGLPPVEDSDTSREYIGNVNMFGGESTTSNKMSTHLKAIEEKNPNTSFVFIADVWLDDVKVMGKLRKLFEGFSMFPPTCFVFIGNFFSSTIRNSPSNVYDTIKRCFQKLAEMISEFPTLVNSSMFVFVPGPQDPEFPEIIPRAPIPKHFLKDIFSRIPEAVFTTNPCRLQYCTQEIVIFREDLVTKMCRNCLSVPTGDAIPTHFAKTLTSQSSLAPLPNHILPVYWDFDHALYLYPLPDLIVCADKYHPFSESNANCQVINPGSFSMSNYVFKVYIPAKRLVEDSHISDD